VLLQRGKRFHKLINS